MTTLSLIAVLWLFWPERKYDCLVNVTALSERLSARVCLLFVSTRDSSSSFLLLSSEFERDNWTLYG